LGGANGLSQCGAGTIFALAFYDVVEVGELVDQKHPIISMKNRLPSAMARHGATRPKPRQADVSLTTPAFDYSSRATTILTPKP
jgi:hypothetical protein